MPPVYVNLLVLPVISAFTGTLRGRTCARKRSVEPRQSWIVAPSAEALLARRALGKAPAVCGRTMLRRARRSANGRESQLQ